MVSVVGSVVDSVVGAADEEELGTVGAVDSVGSVGAGGGVQAHKTNRSTESKQSKRFIEKLLSKRRMDLHPLTTSYHICADLKRKIAEKVCKKHLTDVASDGILSKQNKEGRLPASP